MIIQCQRNLIYQPRKKNQRHGRTYGSSAFVGKVRPQRTRKSFPCKTISDPDELIKLGYTPSSKLMTSKTPANDYQVLKKVA